MKGTVQELLMLCMGLCVNSLGLVLSFSVIFPQSRFNFSHLATCIDQSTWKSHYPSIVIKVFGGYGAKFCKDYMTVSNRITRQVDSAGVSVSFSLKHGTTCTNFGHILVSL